VQDIFLSYNREDRSRAKLFAEAFERQGFSVWWGVGLKTVEAYASCANNNRAAGHFVTVSGALHFGQIRGEEILSTPAAMS
jgi:hypothetical protein